MTAWLDLTQPGTVGIHSTLNLTLIRKTTNGERSADFVDQR